MTQKCKQCKKKFIQTRRRKSFCTQNCAVVFHNKSKTQRDILKKISEKKSPYWLGEKAGYFAKHLWIRKKFGSASSCEKCKTEEKVRFEWANISGKYFRKRSDFVSLCVKCHRSMDLGNIVYQFTMDGVYLRSFSSCAEGARYVGRSKQSILNVVHGRRKSVGGFKWSRDY